MGKLKLAVTKCPSEKLAVTNCVYVNAEDAKLLYVNNPKLPANNYCVVKDYVFCFREEKTIQKGELALNGVQRNLLYVSLNEPLEVSPWEPKGSNLYLETLKFEVDLLVKAKKEVQFDCAKLEEVVLRDYTPQVFSIGQKITLDIAGTVLALTVSDISCANLDQLTGKSESSRGHESSHKRGILIKQTQLQWTKASNTMLRLIGEGGVAKTTQLFKQGFSFETLGIGGLDREFGDIFRRAFAARIFPPSVVNNLGVPHVKGILLYGPPGTGKTLMARQIGKMLNGREPKVVNGPEILNKYVGQSEENIRKLFEDAEKEYSARGDESDLHIIIFDEIDAICKARGGRADNTGVGDTVVNQLLSKIDGVNSLNNILVIGMTNRKDLIDEALLRPGRLEVHMEISLPDEKGRLQILQIHTATMSKNGYLDSNVNLPQLAIETKNFSGAEIAGLVRNATSFALARQVDPKNMTKAMDPTKIKVSASDFEQGLSEMKPAFGADMEDFSALIRNGIINYGPQFQYILERTAKFLNQVLHSERTPGISILLEGPPGSGRTALSAHLATSAGIPFVKLLSPANLVGYSEAGKCAKITKTFDDAYKSNASCIVIDDIERLLDYVPIGPRFSNAVLQTLLVLLKKPPPPGKKMLILCTTSVQQVLEEMELLEAFAATINIPLVTFQDEFKTIFGESGIFTSSDMDEIVRKLKDPVPVKIPIKKLLYVIEMTRELKKASNQSAASLFLEAARDYGIFKKEF